MNNAPTLTVTNGNSVMLKSGKTASIEVELSDPDTGDTVKLLPAPGYRTSCLSISGNIVTVDKSDLMGCDIA